jgi:CHC2 zinc finger
MNSDLDMNADSYTLTKKEQWEQPDREAVIRDNPLLEYGQRHGLQLRRDGAADRYKCLCPLHREKTPSFTIFADQGRFHCFGCGRNGNVIDLHAALKGVFGMEALCDLAGIEYHGAKRAGSARQTEEKNNTAQSQPGNAESYDPFKDPEKAQNRQAWPVFEVPTRAEIEAIATLRGLSPEGVALAAKRGLLFTADYKERRAWVITDSRRLNAQARRLDGNPWEQIGSEKARTLPGSIGALPIGLREALSFPAIALVEGGPDLLAAFHLAWCSDVENCLGVIAMMGRHPILENALPRFAGKHVRIFADADKPGLEAEGRWWHQLDSAGAKVDGYSFTGFIRSDGKPVKDLNDFALIDPDQWEALRDAIEEAFSFSD